ncbi:hypothetical protein RYX36_008602, partial [Vicia faba]
NFAEELDRVKKVLSLCKLFQQHNLLPDFSMDPSSVPSTSSQTPMFNNLGDIIPHDVNGTKVVEYVRVIMEYQDMIKKCEEELDYVKKLVTFYRQSYSFQKGSS